jgi:hypothetical protein
MSEEIESRLRLAGPELRPSRGAEELALRSALAALPKPAPGPLHRLLAARPRRQLALLAAAVSLILIGVVAWILVSNGSSSPALVVVSGGSGRFPSETLTDWVSYGDQVSVVSVVGEEALPAEVIEPGSSYVPRSVVLRVERTIWRRRGAPSAEGMIRVITYGWSVRDGKRHPVAGWGGPRLEVGKRYVTPLVRAPRDGVDWTPLAVESTLPLDGDVITTAGVVGAPSSIAKEMTGRPVDDLATSLARTRPDPIAAKYFDLPPDQRWQAVRRAQGEAG